MHESDLTVLLYVLEIAKCVELYIKWDAQMVCYLPQLPLKGFSIITSQIFLDCYWQGIRSKSDDGSPKIHHIQDEKIIHSSTIRDKNIQIQRS